MSERGVLEVPDDPRRTIIDIGDHRVEVLATPEQTDDRYSLRVTAEPGGGPGIDGDDPHIHPKLTQTFREAVLPAGWAKALIRPLAIVGRLRGYRPDPPIELDRTV